MQVIQEVQRLRSDLLRLKRKLWHCSRHREAEAKNRIETEKTCEEALGRLMAVMDKRESNKSGHSHRVAAQTVCMGIIMGLDADCVRSMYRGALLHDIGKIGVCESILMKEGALTVKESNVMRQHVMIGLQIIGDVFALDRGLAIPRSHHEWFDGSGYPEGLAGHDIPLEARLFTVVDVYDALRTHRPYRDALSPEAAGEVITTLAGTQFDPAIVDVFTQVKHGTWESLACQVSLGMRYEDCVQICRSARCFDPKLLY